MKFQGTVSGEGYGYVYVMSYPGSDKVKIGHTLNPSTRAAQIGGTLAPETPTLEAYFWCAERREDVERKAHVIEKANRANGEWFKVSVTRALEVIQQAAHSVGVEIQLAYDRNEWEAQAAAKAGRKLAALPTLSDDDLWCEHAKYVGAFITRDMPAPTDYSRAVAQEYNHRLAVRQAAKQATQAEARERAAAWEAESVKAHAEAVAQLQTPRAVANRFMSLVQVGLGFLTALCLFGGIASLIEGGQDTFWGTLSIATVLQAVAWLDRDDKLQTAIKELA